MAKRPEKLTVSVKGLDALIHFNTKLGPPDNVGVAKDGSGFAYNWMHVVPEEDEVHEENPAVDHAHYIDFIFNNDGECKVQMSFHNNSELEYSLVGYCCTHDIKFEVAQGSGPEQSKDE